MTQMPIYNLLMKIHHLGIRGKCSNFIEKLYLSSKACVRVKDNYRKSYNIKKGVRQCLWRRRKEKTIISFILSTQALIFLNLFIHFILNITFLIHINILNITVFKLDK